MTMRPRVALTEFTELTIQLTILALLSLTFVGTLFGQTSDTDWSVTTGDKASRRYAPLDQIDRDNLERLEVAWRWSSPDNDVTASEPRLQRPSMAVGVNQVTPIKVGERLYVTTGLGQSAAIDPGTGKTLWVYNPKSYEQGRPPNVGFAQIRSVAPDRDPETIRLPSGLNAVRPTVRACPGSVWSSSPVLAFHRRTVVSLDPETTY